MDVAGKKLYVPDALAGLGDGVRAAGFAVTADATSAEVLVVTPAEVPQPADGRPRVLYVAYGSGLDLGAGVAHLGAIADAYASDARTLVSAVRFAARAPARDRGPLRLVWLGPCGGFMPDRPPIGHAVALGTERVLIGRDPSAAMSLRDGAHSDTCTIARRHASMEWIDGALHVRDLGSTNGVWVRGTRIDTTALAPGDELALCGAFRLRIDGA